MRDQLVLAAAERLDPGNVGSFERLFGDLENHFFSDPLGAFQKLGPMGRTLSAIERYQLEMNDLARGLPPEIMISGKELIEIIGADARKGWLRAWVKRHKSARPLKLRETVLAHLSAQMDRRARIDGAFELVLAQTGLHLVAAWQVYRRHQLAILACASRDETALVEERKWWSRTANVLAGRAAGLIRSYGHWSEASPALLGEAVLRSSPKFSEHRLGKISARWQADFSHWHRQQRAVRAMIDLERQLSIAAGDSAQTTSQSLESLRAERDNVTKELDRAVAWLDGEVEQRNREKFPPPDASLLSAEQRARDWADRISARIHICVPAFVEALRPTLPLPRWRKPWRQLYPQRALLHALMHDGLDAVREGFREVEIEHTAIIRDIEHARQVITFAVEANQAEG
ncbi:MAG: hypothetical protein ACREDL_24750, partial [Bradyrhizobium sp.]